MAVSRSMLELHRVALELEKRAYGLDRPRRVTVQMAETPWTMDPRRQARDQARTGGDAGRRRAPATVGQ